MTDEDLHGGDITAQVEAGTRPPDAIAVDFHYRMVSIHVFPNGNGRHTRLSAGLLAERLGRAAFTWGMADLTDAGETRAAYIAALKAADGFDLGPLAAFARSWWIECDAWYPPKVIPTVRGGATAPPLSRRSERRRRVKSRLFDLIGSTDFSPGRSLRDGTRFPTTSFRDRKHQDRERRHAWNTSLPLSESPGQPRQIDRCYSNRSGGYCQRETFCQRSENG